MRIARWLSTVPLRLRTVFLKKHLEVDLDEELQFHLDSQVEDLIAQGFSPTDARRAAVRALGGMERQKEQCRDMRAGQWLGSLRADVVFGWRQLMKRKVTTAAAVLSLGLAIGACTSAFRLVDALFLRPMPVSDPASLYAVSYEGLNNRGMPDTWDNNSYPLFRQMRDAVKGQAELMAAGLAHKTDLTYGSYQEMESAYLQDVSGEFFPGMGLRPALGRLFTEADDRVAGEYPYAVISYDYWTRRFRNDPKVIGSTFHLGHTQFEIVGVAPKGFTGTEPGTMIDFFIPTMMETNSANNANVWFLRIFARLRPGTSVKALQSKLNAVYQTEEKERSKGFINFPKKLLEGFPNAHLLLESAAEGISRMQKDYGTALIALTVLVGMVLLIACANVANLMSAQAAARAREMALRVSLGAGRWRLVRMVMVESAMLGLMAAGLALLFAWRAAPFVVSRINPPDNPARLVLPVDWAVIGFGFALAMGVTLLFGLLPALRASSVKPVSVLKGGEDPHGRRRLMYGLIGAQVAFCFVVLFVAGLFATTFEKLSNRPTGFVAERVLLLDVVARNPQPPEKWDQMTEQIRSKRGVQSAALAEWPLVIGNSRSGFIEVNGQPQNNAPAFSLLVSPDWLKTMRIATLDGRDFRDSDKNESVAIVNEEFAKQYFGGADPVGRTFSERGTSTTRQIIGLVRDAVYNDLRGPILPQAYLPMHETAAKGEGLKPIRWATLVVRTVDDDPMTMAETLRRAVSQFDPEFRVRIVHTQTGLVRAQTARERLLAMLAAFFAGVALLLAGIGLYGVLSYSVLQREREFGIRIAIGASLANIARLATMRVFAMVLAGAAAGLALGMVSVRYVATLLYGVKGNDPAMLIVPALVLLAVALLAALPAVVRAGRIDPAIMLRAE